MRRSTLVPRSRDGQSLLVLSTQYCTKSTFHRLPLTLQSSHSNYSLTQRDTDGRVELTPPWTRIGVETTCTRAAISGTVATNIGAVCTTAATSYPLATVTIDLPQRTYEMTSAPPSRAHSAATHLPHLSRRQQLSTWTAPHTQCSSPKNVSERWWQV
jgi:hypothetical protein